MFNLMITLRTARELNGYTIEEVAEFCDLTIGEYEEIEKDPSNFSLRIISTIANLYGVSLKYIYAGTENDCVSHNKSRKIGNDV
ncbi:MAG: helix-turn-helix transcriptional regulator [Bacillota bacterium]|nr:helix-turn-helix transcriptional regulator [Bacillota bacterium]